VALNSLAGTGAGFFSWLGRDADRRRRFIGIAAPASTPDNARFTMRYNEAYADKVTTNLSPAAPYDAFYLVAYAAVAAGDGTLGGYDLARAMGRLTARGTHVDVGPSAIFEAAAALRAGQSIDLQGAGGPLDFDVTTGESPADYVFVCPGVTADGRADVEVESGLSFASAEHALRGTLKCP
jgi:ABC-type branched-subunit amino acid transport system substrate-binding protein